MNTEQVGGTHYQSMAYEPAELWIRWELGGNEAAILKYIMRARRKNGAEDIEKAIHHTYILEKHTRLRNGIYSARKPDPDAPTAEMVTEGLPADEADAIKEFYKVFPGRSVDKGMFDVTYLANLNRLRALLVVLREHIINERKEGFFAWVEKKK